MSPFPFRNPVSQDEEEQWSPPDYVKSSSSDEEWKPPDYIKTVEEKKPSKSVFSKIKDFLSPAERIHPGGERPKSEPIVRDKRPDGSEKGYGFLGEFKLPNGKTASEYSIADSEKLKDEKGNYLDYPSLVPTLTKDEVKQVLDAAHKNGKVSDNIKTKAEAYALERKKQGLPLFAIPGEERTDIHPDLERVPGYDSNKKAETSSFAKQVAEAGVEFAKKHPYIKRIFASQDPGEESFLPKTEELGIKEPTTWGGGFAKGLYDEIVRPLSSASGLAGLIGGEEGLSTREKLPIRDISSRVREIASKPSELPIRQTAEGKPLPLRSPNLDVNRFDIGTETPKQKFKSDEDIKFDRARDKFNMGRDLSDTKAEFLALNEQGKPMYNIVEKDGTRSTFTGSKELVNRGIRVPETPKDAVPMRGSEIRDKMLSEKKKSAFVNPFEKKTPETVDITEGFGGSGHPESPEYVGKVLAKAGKGEPGLSIEPLTGDSVTDINTKHVVYRSSNGEPIAVAKIVQDQNGKNLVMDLATDKSKGLLTGRAMKSVGDKLVEMKAVEPAGTISKDAQNFLEKMKERVSKTEWKPPDYAQAVEEQGLITQANKFANEVKIPELVNEGAPPIRQKTGNFWIDDTNRMKDEALSRRADPIRAAEDKAKIDEWNKMQENLRVTNELEKRLGKDTMEYDKFRDKIDALSDDEYKTLHSKIKEEMRQSSKEFDTAKNKQVNEQLMRRMSELTPEEIKQLDSVDELGKPLSRADRGLENWSPSITNEQIFKGENKLKQYQDYRKNEIQAGRKPLNYNEYIKQPPTDNITEMSGGLGAAGLPPEPPIEGPHKEVLDKLFNALGEAKSLSSEQAALNKTERARRFAAFSGVKEEGASGAAKSLGKLRGEFEKVEPGEGLGLKSEETDQLFTAVKRANITPGEKARGYTALFKLMNGESVPQRSELRILDDVFGNGFADRITEMHGGIGAVGLKISKLANTMKSMQNAISLAAPLRHGIGLIARKEFYPAFADMFRFFGNKEYFNSAMQAIEQRPNYMLGRESGLFLSRPNSLMSSEEEFLNSYAGRIPIARGLVGASQRGYTGFLNKLRADTFDSMIKTAKGLGYDSHTMVGQGDKAIMVPTKEAKAIAKYINNATGRGDLGSLNKMTNELNVLLWSPRMISSRLNMLANPKIYTELPKGMRLEGLKSLLGIAALGTMIDTLGAYGGAKISSNILSSDFGKSRFGTKLIDPWGGFQQFIVNGARFLAGKTDAPQPTNRLQIAGRFAASKESPAAALAHNILTAKKFEKSDNPLGTGGFTTQYGQKTTVPAEVMKAFTPIFIQDLQDLATSEPEWSDNIGLSSALGIASLAGMSQDYPERKTLGFRKMKLR